MDTAMNYLPTLGSIKNMQSWTQLNIGQALKVL